MMTYYISTHFVYHYECLWYICGMFDCMTTIALWWRVTPTYVFRVSICMTLSVFARLWYVWLLLSGKVTTTGSMMTYVFEHFWPPLQWYPDDLLHAHTNFVDFRVCPRITLWFWNYWVALACLCMSFFYFNVSVLATFAICDNKASICRFLCVSLSGFGYLCMFMFVFVFASIRWLLCLPCLVLDVFVCVCVFVCCFFWHFATTKPHTSNTSRIYVHTVLVSIMYWSVVGDGLITKMCLHCICDDCICVIIVFFPLYLCLWCFTGPSGQLVTEAVDSQSYVVFSYICFVFVFVFVSLFNLYLRPHCVVLQSLEEWLRRWSAVGRWAEAGCERSPTR